MKIVEENTQDIAVTNWRITEVINGIKVVNMPYELTPFFMGLTTMYPKISKTLELINFVDEYLVNQTQFGCYGTDLRAAAVSLARHRDDLDHFIERANRPFYWSARLMWLADLSYTLVHEARHALGFTHGENADSYRDASLAMRDEIVKAYDITPMVWSDYYIKWEKVLMDPSMVNGIRHEDDIFSLNILRQENMFLREVWALFDLPDDTVEANDVREGFRLMSSDRTAPAWRNAYEDLPILTTYLRTYDGIMGVREEEAGVIEKGPEVEMSLEVETALSDADRLAKILKEEILPEEPGLVKPAPAPAPVPIPTPAPAPVVMVAPVLAPEPIIYEPSFIDEEGITDYGFMADLEIPPFQMEDCSPSTPPEGVDVDNHEEVVLEKKYTKNVYGVVTNTGVNVAPSGGVSAQKLAVENLIRTMFKNIVDICGFNNGYFSNPEKVLEVPETLADKWAEAGVTSYKTMAISNSKLPSIEFTILAGNKKIRRQLIPQNPDKTNAYGSLTANAKKVRSGIGIANIYGDDPATPGKDKIWFIANHNPTTGETKLDFDPFKK